MTPERGRYCEGHTVVRGRGLGDQPRQILGHVSTWREHEWMDHDPRRPSFYTAGECSCDRRFCDLHVRGLDDTSGTEALPHERRHLIEQLIGLGAAATVINQENRFGVAHRNYLGLRRVGVKKRPGLGGTSHASG